MCPIPEAIELEINTTVWKYSQISSLATAGIYTQEDLKAWETGLILPAETRAREAALTARYYGTSSYTAGGSGINLMNQFDVTSLAEKLWGGIKGIVSWVGETTAIILGFVTIALSASQIIDCSIRICTLLRFHGCSVTGLLSIIPGGSILVWAKEKITGKSDFEKMMSLTPEELVQFQQKIREAYVVLDLKFGEAHLYPNIAMEQTGNNGSDA